MPPITFTQRAVAYIDVLGFKSLVESAVLQNDSLSQLNGLVDLLNSAVPTFDARVNDNIPRHLVPKHNYISDSIILSAPVNDPRYPGYDGLEITIMRCIQLTHLFLRAGYLLRGGIEVGLVWHDDRNIVGPGYQSAYLLEQSARFPRIILGEGASTYWRANLSHRNRMCIERDQALIVNGLHDYYIDGNLELGVIQDRYREYINLVDKTLNNELVENVRSKWEWFSNYLQDESRRLMPHYN